MKYLTVGTSEIKEELFKTIESTDTIKPKGGLWLTVQDSRYNNYNPWVDFILEEPVLFFYKNRGKSLWKQPCSLVTLKENAKIFSLDSRESLEYLIGNYSNGDNGFSYELVSRDYDGMFIHMLGLLNDISDDKTREQIFKFGVNSLVLFNLSCIDYYQSGIVSIEPFDYEYGSAEGTTYDIRCEDTKKRVLKK